MTTFDVHQHLWPEQLISTLSRRSEPPRLRGRTLEISEGSSEVELDAHTLETRLALLDREGIDVAVISFPPTFGTTDEEVLQAWHEGALELVEAANGRLAALGAASMPEGFVGACVAGRALADLDALAPLLEELERGGRFLFVHPGPGAPVDGPGWWSAVVDYTAEMQAAYAGWLAGGAVRYPRLKVVFAILAGGAPIQLERLRSRGGDERASFDNVFLDTASYGRRAFELCLAAGAGRLVFGSDAPVIAPRTTLQELEEFGDAVRRAICDENPSLLLPR